MTRAMVLCLLGLWSLVFLGGCASRSVDLGNSQQVSFSASLKQLGVGTNITRVVLEVSGSDFSSITRELSVVQGVVHAEVEVPYGTGRVFALSAFAGATLLYFGADTTDVSTGDVTEVSIYMRPQVPMIKITPTYANIVGIGLEGSLRVEVFNIDSLFGVAFRLEADSSIIKFTAADAGTFLGSAETTLFFSLAYTHYLAAAYTMRGLDGQPDGVSGSGLVATAHFLTKALGKTQVTFAPSTLLLIDRHGNALPREGQIHMESGEVEVSGS